MNWIDLTLLSALVLFGARGYFKGLFREVLSLAGLLLGFIAAVRYDDLIAALARTYWDTTPLILKGIAFVAIFFVIYFFFNLLGWLLHRSERMLFLQTVNRIGGIVIGLGKGAAVAALLISFLGSASWLPHATRDEIEGARLAPSLSRLGDGIVRFGKERLFARQDDEANRLPKFRSES